MLNQKALTPGQGWGCLQCGLDPDGAMAALCDDCAEAEPMPVLRFVFDGYVMEGKLIPISELPDIPHDHNMKLHPEIH